MTTLAELVKQKEALEQQIEKIQSEGRSIAIAEVKAIMAEHGLTPADISGKAPKAAAAGTKVKNPVAVKFRDKDSPTAWVWCQYPRGRNKTEPGRM